MSFSTDQEPHQLGIESANEDEQANSAVFERKRAHQNENRVHTTRGNMEQEAKAAMETSKETNVVPEWIKTGVKCMARYHDSCFYRAVIQDVVKHSDGGVEVVVAFTGFESEGDEVVGLQDLRRIAPKELQPSAATCRPSSPSEQSWFSHLQGNEMYQELRTKFAYDTDEDYGNVLTTSEKIKNNKKKLVEDKKNKDKKKKGILQVTTHKGKETSKRQDQQRKKKLNSPENTDSDKGGRHQKKPFLKTNDDDDVIDDYDDDDDKAEFCWDEIEGFDDKDMEKPHFTEPATEPFVPLVLSDPGQHPIIQVPATINCRLREYQREGVKFLYKHYRGNKGAILGDDMGLGKTVQVIAFLAALLGKSGTKADVFGKYMDIGKPNKKGSDTPKQEGCFLIVSPGSVLYNWRDELDTWGYFKVRLYHGSSKEGVLEYAAKGKLDIVLTTYETLKINLDKFNRVQWLAVIMDEAHRLKDSKAQITMAAKALKVKRRYGLTGTPLQNRFAEFWCVLDWANPGCLGSSKKFMKEYSRPIKKGQRFNVTKRELAVGRTMSKQLQSQLSQWLLRRTKDLISDQLPCKDDRVVFCPMTSFQEDIYVTLLQSPDVKLITRKDFPCDCGSGVARGKCCYQTDQDGEPIRSVLMRFLQLLLKAANHTALLMPQVKQTRDQRYKAKVICDQVFARHPEYAQSLSDSSFQTLSDPSYCGKMKVLDRLLRMFEKEKSKVLLFSQSFQLLNILEEFVIGRGLIYSRLDGKTRTNQRAAIVREFNNNPEIFVCLISTRAGALGLNFTGANVVIIFDPTWNPANDLQAQDRAYRIGQRRDVQVFRLISSGTIEEMMYLRQIYKQQMANIAVKGTSERRYFTGVEGEKDLKGELFGVENLFSYRAEGVCLAQDIITRTDKLEAGLRVEKYRIVEKTKQDEEVDQEKLTSSATNSETDDYDLEEMASQFFEDQVGAAYDRPSTSGIITGSQEEEEGTSKLDGDDDNCDDDKTSHLKDQPNTKSSLATRKTSKRSKKNKPSATIKDKKAKNTCFPTISRKKRLRKYLAEFFSSGDSSSSNQESQSTRAKTNSAQRMFGKGYKDTDGDISDVIDSDDSDTLADLSINRRFTKVKPHKNHRQKLDTLTSVGAGHKCDGTKSSVVNEGSVVRGAESTCSKDGASCNVVEEVGGYFSMSEGDERKELTSKTQKKGKHKLGRVEITTSEKKPKVVIQHVKENVNNEVENLLSKCGVSYTHANRTVVCTSKAESHMSKRAIQDVFELRQFSQQPANCFAAFEVSDESDDVAEKSTKGRDTTPGCKTSCASSSRSTKTLINKPSEVFDKSSAVKQDRSESRTKKTTPKGNSKRRKEMTSRFFKRKGVVFDDDDDDDDHGSQIPSAKREKVSSTRTKNLDDNDNDDDDDDDDYDDDDDDDDQSNSNLRNRTNVSLSTTRGGAKVSHDYGTPGRTSRKCAKSSFTCKMNCVDVDAQDKMNSRNGVTSTGDEVGDDFSEIRTIELKESKTTKNYNDNIGYSHDKGSFIDELFNRTKAKQQKPLSTPTDIVLAGSGMEKSRDTTDHKGGKRGQHLSSLLDEFLDSTSVSRHSKSLDSDTEMVSYVNHDEDNQSELRTSKDETNDFISSSERKKSILDDFI